MSVVNNVMTMLPMDGGIEIKPGETVRLDPNGSHIMFVGLKKALQEGDHVAATLTFAKAGTVSVEMFLDASEGGQVKTTVDKLLAAVLPAKGTDDKQKPVAPYVALGWGKVTYVSCAVVNSVSAAAAHG